jgi:hypothetical protein
MYIDTSYHMVKQTVVECRLLSGENGVCVCGEGAYIDLESKNTFVYTLY